DACRRAGDLHEKAPGRVGSRGRGWARAVSAVYVLVGAAEAALVAEDLAPELAHAARDGFVVRRSGVLGRERAPVDVEFDFGRLAHAPLPVEDDVGVVDAVVVAAELVHGGFDVAAQAIV